MIVAVFNSLSWGAFGALFGAFFSYVYCTAEYEKLTMHYEIKLRRLEQQKKHAEKWECFELKFRVRDIEENLQQCRELLDKEE